MEPRSKFRVLLQALATIVGCYGIVSGAAEETAWKRPSFTNGVPNVAPAPVIALEWLRTISPIRSDLESNETLILALAAIRQPIVQSRAAAEGEYLASQLKHVLSVRPYDAELWLGLAVLEARRDPNGPATIESLKMSYLTAPSAAPLMPLRLNTTTRFDALADLELRELARSDVRLMLTRQPDQTSAFVSAYDRASGRGKAFLQETAQTVAPSILKLLRN